MSHHPMIGAQIAHVSRYRCDLEMKMSKASLRLFFSRKMRKVLREREREGEREGVNDFFIIVDVLIHGNLSGQFHDMMGVPTLYTARQVSCSCEP